MLNIIVTDAVWLVDRADIYKFYLVVSVNDSTAIVDWAQIGDYTASVTTSVSVLDSPTVSVIGVLKQQEVSLLPVVKAKASFARVFTSSRPKLPVRSDLGYSGASLREKRIPLRTISAHVAEPTISLYGGAGILPTYTASGRFGMRLDKYIPIRTLEASFDLAGIFSLDAVIPTRTLSATFRYPDSFTLSRQIPIWIGQGSLVLGTYAATLNARIPGAFILAGTLRDTTGCTMSAYIPVWKLNASIYQSSFSGSGNVISVVFPRAVVREENRFSDYVLRYNRG